MMLCPLLAATALPGGVPQDPTGDGRVMRVVPVHGLLRIDGRGHPLLPLPPFIRTNGVDEVSLLLRRDGLPGLSESDIVQIVSEVLQQPIEEDRLTLEGRRDAVVALGDNAAVKRVGEVVDALGAAVPRYRLDAWLLAGGDEGLAGTDVLFAKTSKEPALDQAAWAQATWQTTSVARGDEVVSLGVWRRTPIVYGIELEVAQEASVSVPTIGKVTTGCGISLRVSPLGGSSDVVVVGEGAVAELAGPIETLSTGIPENPSIDGPVVEYGACSFSARVADGGGFALRFAGREGQGVDSTLVVRVTRVSPAADPNAAVTVIPTRGLTEAGLSRGVSFIDEEAEAWGPYLDFQEQAECVPPLEIDELIGLIQMAFQNDLDEERLRLYSYDGGLVLWGDPTLRARVVEMVARIENDLLKTTRVGSVSGDGSAAVHDVAFPALQGRPHVWMRGVEQRVLHSFRYAIAQKSAVLGVAARTQFAGVVGSILLARADSGVHVDASIDLIARDRGRSRRLEGPRGGVLDVAAEEVGRFRHDAVAMPGTDIDLGLGPVIDGRRVRQSLQLR